VTTLPTVRRQILTAAEGLASAGHRRERLRPLLGWALAAASLAVVAVVVIAIGRVRHETAAPTPSTRTSGGPGLAAPVLKPGQAWLYTEIEQQVTPWRPGDRSKEPSMAITASTHAAVIQQAVLSSWVLPSGDMSGDGHVLEHSRFIGSAAERSVWRADGSRPLVSLAPGRFHTVEHGFDVGDRAFTYAQLLRFPADARTLFGRPTANEFDEIDDIFVDTPLPPAARAAVFGVLVRLPGVLHLGSVRDPLGRSGVGFALHDPALPQRLELIFDPRTKALLASETVLLRSTGVAGIGAGYPVSWDAYVRSKAVPAAQVPPVTPPPCLFGVVQLTLGPLLSMQTGEHAYLFALTDRSNSPCTLRGYPHVTLSHDGRALPFVYRQGGGRYVSARKPRAVTLQPGQKAYFLVAKYRCDGKTAAPATAMNVGGARLGGGETIDLAPLHITDLDYCAHYPGDAKVDPGNYITVSPTERTVSAALAPPP
jgi:hypothetical protein